MILNRLTSTFLKHNTTFYKKNQITYSRWICHVIIVYFKSARLYINWAVQRRKSSGSTVCMDKIAASVLFKCVYQWQWKFCIRLRLTPNAHDYAACKYVQKKIMYISWAQPYYSSIVIIQYYVVIFFWSSGVMVCMLFTFITSVPLMSSGASVVWHLLLPLMNSFNKTEAAFSPMQVMLSWDFSFSSGWYNFE